MEEPNTNNSGEHEAPVAPAEAPKETPAAPAEASSEATTAHNPAPASAPAALAEAPKMNFFGALISALKKPISTLEDDAEKFKAPKNAIILTLISAGILTVTSLIMSIIETVHSSSCSLFGGGCKSVWYWNNLKNFDWLGSTLWRFLGVVIAMFAVAAVFFGFSRLFKQTKSNYCRMLSAIAVSEFPLAIGLLLTTFVSLLSPGVALAVLCVCATYAGVMLYEGINLDANLHGDKKFYFNALSIISLVILSYSGFQIYLNMSVGSSLKGATMELQDSLDALNDLQNLFDY